MALDDIAAGGNQVATLKGLRDLLAAAVVRADLSGDATGTATLSARLSAVLDRIAELEPDAKKGTALDEFTQRRENRKTPRPPRAAKRQ